MTGDERPGVAPEAGDEPHWSAWYSLGVLTVVLLFATVDRAVLILLAAAALLWWCERSYGQTIDDIARGPVTLEAVARTA